MAGVDMQAIYAETEKLDWIEKIPDTLAEVSDHFDFLFCYSYEISNTKCIEKHTVKMQSIQK